MGADDRAGGGNARICRGSEIVIARCLRPLESIDVVGDVATAKLVETGFMGSNFVDFFQLLGVEGEWKIISKTYHQEN